MLNSCSHLWDPGLCVYLCLGCWNLPLTLKAADNGTGKQARGLTSFIYKKNKELKAQRVQNIMPRLKSLFSFWPVVNYSSRLAWVALMQTLISDCWQAQECSLSTITKVECFIFRDHLHQAALTWKIHIWNTCSSCCLWGGFGNSVSVRCRCSIFEWTHT